ncbi:unnamed protein product [marine sediment metagenome]|uniref:Uncharacterized protein n=1 Tax=marine sediment metagenome TaxID=412755 RepID=X1DVC5_9ZZZZ
MTKYEEEEIKELIEEHKDENSAFADYAAHLLFNAAAYAA